MHLKSSNLFSHSHGSSPGIAHVPIPLTDVGLGHVFAGATRNLPEGYTLVRCAAEIPVRPETRFIDVGTVDFSPFDPDVLDEKVPVILAALQRGEALYVGCMGGTGRTGTLLSILVAQHPAFTGETAILYIRQVYRKNAVETAEQAQQVIGCAHRYGMPATVRSPVPALRSQSNGHGVGHAPARVGEQWMAPDLVGDGEKDVHLGSRIRAAWNALWGVDKRG